MREETPDETPSGESGFTLLEMLVALALLALLLGAMPNVLRLGNHALAKIQAIAQSSHDAAAWSFLRAKIAEARPLFEPSGDGRLVIAFTGTRNAMSFVAPFREAGEASGLSRFTLEAVPRSGGKSALELSWERFGGSPSEAGQTPSEARTVSASLKSCRMRYFGQVKGSGAPTWVEEWTRLDELPRLAEITFTEASGAAPREQTLTFELQLSGRDWQRGEQ